MSRPAYGAYKYGIQGPAKCLSPSMSFTHERPIIMEIRWFYFLIKKYTFIT